MKLTCDEATTICDKSQYGEASFWEKIKLSFHIFMCKNCSLYSKQNAVLSKCLQKQKCKNNCLCEKEKSAMEEEIKVKI
ncbi:hypothetical protein R3X25_03525 [Lutibacter sp. TH_r2]|uniref:hypothetical protein n=1 Tax=Lutibacter sp. TH_r2 TaxID=3082083 RepID=UPI0029552589|nr:hypothetical protein [Lutibacter sp. TH_r2]MDV7186340.1 hypothetical protein [Lutibacter sp. TH_r2]